MLPPASDVEIARFMRFVEKLPSGCWFWNGARSRGKGNRKFYGSFKYRGRAVRAHRFSCECIADPPKICPSGHHRDHLCEFSLCVNPDCVEIVTHEENERRKKARRSAR